MVFVNLSSSGFGRYFFSAKAFSQLNMQADLKPETPPCDFTEEHEYLRALLENASDGIYFKDKDSRFLLCSKFKYKRHVQTQEEMRGRSDFDFFDPIK